MRWPRPTAAGQKALFEQADRPVQATPTGSAEPSARPSGASPSCAEVYLSLKFKKFEAAVHYAYLTIWDTECEIGPPQSHDGYGYVNLDHHGPMQMTELAKLPRCAQGLAVALALPAPPCSTVPSQTLAQGPPCPRLVGGAGIVRLALSRIVSRRSVCVLLSSISL